MEAAIRASVQVGGPPPSNSGQQQQQRGGSSQQTNDNGPSSQQLHHHLHQQQTSSSNQQQQGSSTNSGQQHQHQQQQQQTNMSAYQQRISSGASPIHRPIETSQSYKKGGNLGSLSHHAAQQMHQPQMHHHQQQQQQHHHQQQQQQSSRSAASPLSPPRPGPGSAATASTYAKFGDVNAVREAPHRYIQQSSYSIGPGAQYRDSPHTRIPQIPPSQVQEYHRAAAAVAAASASNNTSSVVQVTTGLPPPPSGAINISGTHLDTLHFMHQTPAGATTTQLLNNSSGGNSSNTGAPSPHNANSGTNNIIVGRQRILLPAHAQAAQYPNEYLPSAAVATVAAVNRQQHHQQQQQPQQQHAQQPQAPPDPGGQPYKKLRLSDTNVTNTNHLPSPQIVNAQQRQLSPAAISLSQANSSRNNNNSHMQLSQPKHTHLTVLPAQPPLSVAVQQLKVETQPPQLQSTSKPLANRSTPTTVGGSFISTQNTTVVSVTNSATSSSSEAYHPQVEAISPTLPSDNAEERGRTTKEDLLMQIQKVDTDIQAAENTMEMLKKKETTLLETAAVCKQENEQEKKPEEDGAEDTVNAWRSQTLAQKIYEANRKTAAAQHSILNKCGTRYMLPLYNQPLDVDRLQTIIKRHQISIKDPLLEQVRKIKHERWLHNTGLVDRYTQMSADWQKRIEKAESSAKRKAREAKNREFFEKVFTELRKQREDKERFNRVGSRIKSEADLEEIMDGLQEQAMEDKKMRSYAVIPPLMYDLRQRRCVYHNENGFITDMIGVHKEQQMINVWTTGEKEIFKEKFLQHPKNFGAIAASLDRKSAQDCVRYYYLSKKTENYKQLLRKSRQRTRSSRNPQKTQQQQTQCIIDSLTTGVTTRLQREQQQKTGGRLAAAERERAAEKAAADAVKTATAIAIKGKSESNNEILPKSAEEVDTTKIGSGSSSDKLDESSTTLGSPITATTIETATTTIGTTATNKSNSKGFINSSDTNNIQSVTTATKTNVEKANSESSVTNPTVNGGTTVKVKADDAVIAVATTINDKKKIESDVTSAANGNEVNANAVTTPTSDNTEKPIESACSTDEKLSLTVSSNTATPTIISTTTSTANSHPPAQLNTPNGIKSAYAVAIAAAAAAAVAVDEHKIGASTAAVVDKSATTPDVVPNEKSIVVTPTTSTTAGSFLGQKLKAAQVEGIGAGNECNSDASDPKKKRLDTTDASLSSTLISSSSPASNASNIIGKELNAAAPGDASANSTASSAIAVADETTKNSSLAPTIASTTSTLTITITTTTVASATTPATTTTTDATSNNTIDSKDKLATCFVCKAEACPRTRPLKKGRGQQYGIADDTIVVGARVCNSCQCKSVRNRYPNCPIPTCPNPKDRAKRLHNIPARLFELATDVREPIMHEFQIPAQASRCCSACLMRIRRKLDPHINLTDEERRTTDGDESDVSTSSCDEREAGGSDTASVDSPENPQRHNSLTKDLKKPLTPMNANSVKTNTADTTTVTITVTKPDERLLPPLGHAPRKQKTSEEYDSSATETADEENENSPANRQSPKVTLNNSGSISGSGSTTITSGLAPPILNVQSNGPQPLPPSSQPGRESALNVQDFLYTMIEHSLKAKAQPPTKLPTQQQHISPHISKSGGEQSSRRTDLANSVSNNNNSNNDVTIVREYRTDGSIVKQQIHGQPMPHNIQNLSSRQQNSTASLSGSSSQGPQVSPDNLATLSVVNSHISGQHLPSHNMIHQHDVKATITPVVKSGKNSTPPHPPETIIYGVPTSAQQHRSNEPEPQTLDLSIKKPSRDGPSPHSLSSSVPSGLPDGLSRHQPPLSTVKHVSNAPSIYRGPEPMPLLGPNPTYLSYHPHPATVTKAPPGAFLVSQVPVPLSITQGRSQTSAAQQQSQSPQTSQTSSAHMQLPSSATIGGKGPSKMVPKLSPQLIHHPTQHVPPPSSQQILVGGPKGSITHGTPVNNSQQIIVHTSSNTLSPKFDSILRQTPPSSTDSKLGSITQGTPIHLPGHHLENKRAYEYYKSSQRQSPAQQPGPPPPPQQSSPQAPPSQNYGVNSPYVRSPYGVEQSPVLSTRQIVMHDYITSQQMQGQQRNVSRGSAGGGTGSDKESPSPRNNVNSITSGLVYYDKDRGRTEYSSRASPADHINSTPSPHRTPPPQRQGVIQRHNTGSKPPSPAASQQRSMHVMSHNYPPAGHEAFSSFVDVAVQQPQLPVPSQKDEKSTRHEQLTHPPHQHPSSQAPSRHEIRYQMNRDQMAMQIQQHAAAAAAAAVAQQYHHHVAANAAAAVDLQRRMDQAKRDQRMHGIERDMQKRQERDMNRLHQERMQAERERIDRERERDRERVRERREQQRAADEQAREDRRMERIYAGNATAAAVGAPHYMRVPPDSGPPRAIPDHERDPYHRTHPGQPSDGTLSAQVLIDAIIKHQISQGSSEPNPTNINRDMTRTAIYNSRDIPLTRQHAPTAAALAAVENNGKSSSPNVINIDLDNDRMGSTQYDPSTSNSRGQIHNSRGPPSQQGPSISTSQSHSTQSQQSSIMTKGMTLGELTDSIITNDFGPNPMRQTMRPTANFMPYMQDPQTIVTPERWKYHRMQQKEAEAAVAAAERGKSSTQNTNSSGNLASNNGGSGSRSNTPGDDRNTITSPRKYVHEIMPHQTSGVVQHESASHYYHPLGPPPTNVPPIGVHSRSSSGNPNLSSGSHDQRMSAGNTGSIQANATSVQNHHFDTMKYVQNRIVEVMRTEDDHRGEELHHQHNDHRGNNKTLHETPVSISGSRKTPNQYDERDGRRSSSSTASNNDSQHATPNTGLGPYQQQVPVTTFAPTTYAYPYSALNVPSSPVGLQPPPQMTMQHQPASHISKQQVQHTHSTAESGGPGINNAQPSTSSSTTEPKPLLSAQYEALSDED